ncbi:lipase domain protein [Trypanosoma grayi]|uniref:lipase domain protein n=1 Tax=Trypanosoma grayi TaxID=71804 RepID=UPI0004F45930|nr:lipase domain protein [Trypanosoma grayi]KEG14691.1 lipase domain protein [Trypanosoma grayi]
MREDGNCARNTLTEPLLPHAADTAEQQQQQQRQVDAVSQAPPYSARGGLRNGGSSRRLRSDVSDHARPHKRLVAELQIETLSTGCTRLFLYSWYAMLILALILQSFLSLQWKMTNICGSTEESLHHLDAWSSPCVRSYSYLSYDIIWSEYAVGDRHHVVPIDVLHGIPVEGEGNKASRGVLGNGTLPKHLHNLRWVGGGRGSLLDVKLNRFVRVVLSMASPQENLPEGLQWKRYPLMIALEQSPLSPLPQDGSNSFSSSRSIDDSSDDHFLPPTSASLYNTTTLCSRTERRCSSVVLPQDVVVANNGSRITLTIFGVEEELGNVSALSAVGIVFQRSAYTIGTIVWRYGFLLFSFLHLIRFVYRKRYSKTLYEQYWVMLLHLGLYLYLDPFFAAGIYEVRGAAVYRFFEFRMPNYFAALFSCFIFALITASIDWTYNGRSERSEAMEPQKASGEDAVHPSILVSHPHRTEDGLLDSRLAPAQESHLHLQQQAQKQEQPCFTPRVSTHENFVVAADGVRPIEATLHRIPFWAKMAMTNFFVGIICLDVARAYIGGWDWGTDTACTSFSCLYILYTFYSLLLLFIVLCCVLLVWLHRNLGKRPYLETRPQQLSCRVFIFVFTTALVYFVVQVVLIALLYPQIIGIAAYQPFTQLSPVMVSTFFVNHITFVYTTTVASRRVPIRPDNPHWRRVVWSSEWYRWLNLHGGILYIFYNEQQERHFNWLQNKRQMPSLSRRRRLRDSVAVVEANVNDSKSRVREPHENTFGVAFGSPKRGGEDWSQVEGGGGSNHLTDEPETDEEDTRSDSYDSHEDEDGDDDVFDSDSPVAVPHTSHESKKRGSVWTILQKAERHLTERPAALMDRLEEALVDPLQSLFLRGRGRMPFFNLETAIDCLNLSWEAYVTAFGNEDAETVNDTRKASPVFTGATFPFMWRRYMPRCFQLGGVSCNDGLDNVAVTEDGEPTAAEAEAATAAETVPEKVPSSPPSLPLPSRNTMRTEQYGYKQVAVFEGRDVQVVITVMDTTLPCHRHKIPRLVIAFRGTDNLSNAREDLRFRQRTWKEVESPTHWGIAQSAKVHTGFLNIWISLKKGVLHTLREYLAAGSDVVYSIFCTGHSLGGALASLCAYSVRRMLRTVRYPLAEVTVYTFGQPPLGNRAFQSEDVQQGRPAYLPCC